MPGIFGIGIDCVDIPRIAELRKKHGDDFGGLLFLPGEIECCMARKLPDECFAARFAAKEAFMKAIGTGWAEGVAFSGIEIIRLESGRPEMRLHGKTADKAQALGIGNIHVTLSHAKGLAVAQVLLENR